MPSKIATSIDPFLSLLPPELFLLIATKLKPEDLASFVVSSPLLSRTYVPLLITYTSPQGETLLTGAVIRRHHGLVHSLLQHGADPNVHDHTERATPLHHASISADLSSVRLLLRFSAHPNASALGDITPLHFAATAADGHTIIPLLIRGGASINRANDTGCTAIWWAASKGRELNVRALLELGADGARADADGWSPLHCAAAKGYAGIVGALVDAGMGMGARDNAGLTPLIYAAMKGHVDAVKILLAKGADVDAGDGMGGTTELTAICCAACAGHEEVVRLLLEAGASVGLRDAVISAGAAGKRGVMEMLLKCGREEVRDRGGELMAYFREI
ncbi:ankyrin repeat-containing domain protein [Tricharina praecox]|uniref:ankyrin repeat-containing domain protein n=1 Tax=Tricharina praecox TaxID=43433 RepID=UPI00221E721B|nr:ankyrin repeat-containing domain protein [Tricharina praecox]KAI5848093.1 ankyrin repeat-containing domain protein [Tricharina praecox]